MCCRRFCSENIRYVPTTTKEMFERAVEKTPVALNTVPDKYKTKCIHERATFRNSYLLVDVSDQYKPQGRCEKSC